MLINRLNDFWSDLHQFTVWWQIAAIALSVLGSYFVAQYLRQRFSCEAATSKAEAIPAQLFVKMIFPIALMMFLYIGKLILLKWQHVYLLSLLVTLCGAWALIRFGIYLSRRIFARNPVVSRLHLLLENVFSGSVLIIALFYYTGILQDMWAFMDETVVPIGRNKLSIAEILRALISVVITVLLALWASAALDKRLMEVNYLHSSLRIVMSRLGHGLLILLAILISLNLVGIDLTILSIFSGALGVGLGLGLQKIASNYVSGFIILLDRSLSIDDLITVDKYSGKVSEITTRYTVLKGLDGIESIIPNEMLVSSPVQNLSLTDKEVLMNTELTVPYSTNLEMLIPMLIAAASSVERVSRNTPPSANLTNFGANGLELCIGFWIIDPENGKSSVLSQVNLAIWKLLKEKNIKIPYAQNEIRVLNQGEITAAN